MNIEGGKNVKVSEKRGLYLVKEENDRCPVCGSVRGTNEYCWGHVNSDGTGYLLPSSGNMQPVKAVKSKKKQGGKRGGGRREDGGD